MSMLRQEYTERDLVDRAKQSFKESCDLNNIIKRYIRTGFIEHVSRKPPFFADVSEAPDYRTAVEQVRAAESFFAGLPAKVRSRFENDVAMFLDEAGRLSQDELVQLGLAELKAPAKEEAPVEKTEASGT